MKATSKTTSQRGSSQKSTRTAIAADPKPGLKETINSIWQQLIGFIMLIVRTCHQMFEVISDVFVKIYRILLFCYRKPKHAKELLMTTIHLIRVSYDAEIWSWNQVFEMIKSHLITPMTKAPPPPPKNTTTSKSAKKVK